MTDAMDVITADPRVRTATMTCEGCPVQIEGALADGRTFYFRYRYGCATLGAGADLAAAVLDDGAVSQNHGDRLQGVFDTYDDLARVFLALLDQRVPHEPRHMKASDIADEVFIRAVLFCCAEREMSWATRWDVAAVLAGHPDEVEFPPRDYPNLPEKVVLAKARKLIRRKLIDGCDCGCRGDFEVTAAGRRLVETAP